jgi:hypothetical protein
MGVYQRDERWMVYFHENGKRKDRSFGRGEEARLRAEAFDFAVKQAKEHGVPIPDSAMVTVGVQGGVQAQAATTVAPVGAVEANTAPVVPVTASVVSVAPVAAPAKGITLGQLATMYLDHLRVSGRTEKHIYSLDKLLKNMFFGRKYDVHQGHRPVYQANAGGQPPDEEATVPGQR